MELLDRVLIIACRYGSGYFACYLNDVENSFTTIDFGITGGDSHWERFQVIAELEWVPIAWGETKVLALQNLETKCANFKVVQYTDFHFILQEWDKVASALLNKTPNEANVILAKFKENW